MQGHDTRLSQLLTIVPRTSVPASPRTSGKRRARGKPSTASAQDKRPRSTRALSQAETRERLLGTARAVLDVDGYAGASIDRIAAAAGYTKGAFYANFPMKEAVFIERFERFEQHTQREHAAFRSCLVSDGDVASVLDAIGHDLQSARYTACARRAYRSCCGANDWHTSQACLGPCDPRRRCGSDRRPCTRGAGAAAGVALVGCWQGRVTVVCGLHIQRGVGGVPTAQAPALTHPFPDGAAMQKLNITRVPIRALAVLAVLAVTAISVRKLVASDHQDTPLVELSPRFDVNDVYAFPSPSDPTRTVLVLGTSSPITPAQTPSFTFGTKDQELYQLKIDNTGDAREDLVFQFTFSGKAGQQKVTMRGPVRPNSVGTSNTLAEGPSIKGRTNTIITAGNIKLFAGPRDDPFFIDLEAFFRILPDRRPERGPLSTITQGPLTFRSATGPNSAVDFLRGINDMAIVVELPTAMIANAATRGRYGVWGTTSRARAN